MLMTVMDFYHAQERLRFYVHLQLDSVCGDFFLTVDVCTMNRSDMCPYTIHAIAIPLGSAHKRSELLPISPD